MVANNREAGAEVTMSRREKIDKLVAEAEQTKDVDRLWEIAKELSALHAWTEYSNTVGRIMELDDIS